MKLISLDMKKAYEHEHPDIRTDGTQYLVQVSNSIRGDTFLAGTFNRVWYGLTFDVFWGQGFQFDAPGYNNSWWVAVWEIVP